MSQRRNQSSRFSYGSLEERRLLASGGFEAGVSVVEETRTLHIRPVVHANDGEFKSHFNVRVLYAANEIEVTEFLPGSAESVNSFFDLVIGTHRFDASTLDNLVYIGTNEADLLFNNTGLDSYIRGRSGADSLNSGWGNDRIFGGGGDDWIDGGSGNDRIEGANGDDRIIGNAGEDILFGHAGNDTIDGGTVGRKVFIACLSIPPGSCPDSNEPSEQTEDGGDTIYGGAGDDTLKGGGGDDLIYGHAGRDYIQGGAGNDIAFGGDGDDWILEVPSSDFYFYSNTDDSGDDLLYGGNGNDELMGGNGNDRIFGQAGDDLIGNTTWNGRRPVVAFAAEPNDFEVSSIFSSEGGEYGNDFIDGGDGDDSIYGGLGDDHIIGGNGDDFVSGSSARPQPVICPLSIDVVCPMNAFDGIDLIFGNDGNDMLLGGSGGDSIFGGRGNDVIAGEAGRDQLFGQQGDDTISGGFGDDIVVGNQGFDKLFGNEGEDELFGAVRAQNQAHGVDELDGGEGSDLLTVDLFDRYSEEDIDHVIFIFR